MKSSLEKNLPWPRYFQHKFHSEAGLEGVEWEGVLEAGKLARSALASHAQGMRDTPHHEHPAAQPFGPRLTQE